MFPLFFAYKECLRGTCPRKHRSVTRLRLFRFTNGGFPLFDRLRLRINIRSLWFAEKVVLPKTRHKQFLRSHPANACGHFSKGNACDRRRWRKKGARVGAAVGDRRGGVSADDGAGHRKREPRFCFHKDQEGRRNSPMGCCVVGNPIKGFPDAAQ